MPDWPSLKFLIVAHREPVAVDRLADRVTTIPGATAQIVWDVGHREGAAQLSGRHQVMLTSAPYGWGGWGQVEGLLQGIHQVAREDFDWLIVLSGSDYPIRPLTDLVDMLAKTEHALFLQTPEGGTVEPPRGPLKEWTDLQRRYYCRYRWVPQTLWSRLSPGLQRAVSGAAQRALHATTRGRGLFVQRRPRGFSPAVATASRSDPFSPLRPCRKGSDWFALSRPVMDDLCTRSRSEESLAQYFRRTYIPSEAYFHTLLLPEWEHLNAGVNLHYRRFTVTSAHPDTLTLDDMGVLASCGQFFARHFDPSDVEVFDTIDKELLGNTRNGLG